MQKLLNVITSKILIILMRQRFTISIEDQQKDFLTQLPLMKTVVLISRKTAEFDKLSTAVLSL